MPEADLPIPITPSIEETASNEAALGKDAKNEKPDNKSPKTQNQIPNNSDKNQSEVLDPLIKIALKEIDQKRTNLKEEIEELEKRKSNLEKEIKESFTGQSDAIARRVKGFQDYLTGALQDLAQSAEQLELISETQDPEEGDG